MADNTDKRESLYNRRKKEKNANTAGLGVGVEANQQKSVVRSWTPSIMTPIAGQLTSTVSRVTQEFLIEVQNTDVKLRDYIKMSRKDPVVSSCIQLKCLRASLMFGRYRYKDYRIQKWVQDNLDQITGSLSHKIGRLGAAMPLGFSAAEIVFEKRPNEWRLKNINILDQTKTSFEGKGGEIENLIYEDGDGTRLAIPYKKIIHVVNGYASNIGEYDSVYGDPESATAYQYYKAKQAILTEMMIAAKQNASGLWVGKADSNETVQVVDSKGNPLYNADGTPRTEPAMLSLLKQMINIENNSIIVTDRKNEITPLSVDSKEGFWNLALSLLDAAIMRAYGVPELVFKEGSGNFGINGIGKQHVLILDAQIQSVVAQIRDQFIEKIVKPLLIWNFGIIDGDYGSFEIDPVNDPESTNLRINNIIAATGAGLIPSTDLTARNAVRSALGIPTISKEEDFVLNQEKLLQDYFSNNIYATGNPPPLFAQQALQDKSQAEAVKQEEGLTNELDQQEQTQMQMEAEQQNMQGGSDELQAEEGTNVDGEPVAETPEQIQNKRARRNGQNIKRK